MKIAHPKQQRRQVSEVSNHKQKLLSFILGLHRIAEARIASPEESDDGSAEAEGERHCLPWPRTG
jgi:hypothetical protein